MYSTFDTYSSFGVYSKKNKEGFQELADENSLTILIKFPSRSRPSKLIDTFREYIAMASNPNSIHTLFTLDQDDETVTPQLCSTLRSIHSNIDIQIINIFLTN
jgi:hypothetical protein